LPYWLVFGTLCWLCKAKLSGLLLLLNKSEKSLFGLHTDSTVSSGLTALRQLRSLGLRAAVQEKPSPFGWQLGLQVPWLAMQNLQDVVIDCGSLSFSSSLLELAEVPSLRLAAFRGCRPAIGSCLAFLESLIYHLRQRPEVSLTCVSLPGSL